MKEIDEEMEKLSREIGYRLAEIEREKTREFYRDTLIDLIKEEIKEREEKIQILKNAEMILLGINYKQYQKEVK